MECCCGETKCRGVIANFLDMPAEARAYYAQRGVLPEHVAAAARERGVVLPASSLVPGGSNSPLVVAPKAKPDSSAGAAPASPLFQATA